MRESHLQLITPYTMHVNTGHVNGYIWEAVMHLNITWIFYWTELGLSGMRIRWPVMENGSGAVGLGKLPSCEFCLK